MFRFCLLPVAVLFTLMFARAHAQRNVPGVILPSPPQIDGIVNLAEWESATRFEESYDEETGTSPPAGYAQQFWLAYDDKFIYLAARLADPDPKRINATETRTNVNVSSDDHIVFFIDPFGNLQNRNQFRVNPNGATQLQIAGGRAPKREWVGEIHAAGRLTETGWECEARIPWSVMQLPSPGVRTLRVDFGRHIPRLGRSYLTSNLAGEQTQNISRWTAVDLPANQERRTIKLLPYGYAGFSNSGSDFIANSGLDLKTSLSDRIELVGTVNPDFRNIENDILSLDFSYFERLAGESRPFFLEGSEFFQTSRDAALFASQRIRSFDAGLKFYGQFNDQTRIAFLNTADFGHEAAYVGNINYQLRPRENIQIAGTLLDKPGLHNSATYLAYNAPLGFLNFFGQYSETQDDVQGDGTRFNAGFGFERHGLGGFIEYQEISPEYIPRLGFAPKVDFKGWNLNMNWERPHPRGAIMETELSLNARDEKTWNGDPFLKSIEGGGSVAFRNNLELEFEAAYEEFEGFRDKFFEVGARNPRSDPYRFWGVSYGWGHVAGEDIVLFGPSFSYRPLKTFQVHLRHQELRHIEDASQTILSMNYELNRFESLSSRLVRRDDDTNIYFAWKRAGNRGIEYYVILGDPNARSFRQTLILKAVMPLEIVLRRFGG